MSFKEREREREGAIQSTSKKQTNLWYEGALIRRSNESSDGGKNEGGTEEGGSGDSGESLREKNKRV